MRQFYSFQTYVIIHMIELYVNSIHLSQTVQLLEDLHKSEVSFYLTDVTYSLLKDDEKERETEIEEDMA